MITVYADRDVFETIILFEKDYPFWNKILLNHSQVVLNIEQAYIINDDSIDSPINMYRQLSGMEPIDDLSSFNLIASQDPDDLEDKLAFFSRNPRSVYLLNLPIKETEVLEKFSGVFVKNFQEILDNELKGEFFRSLNENDLVENNWSGMLQNVHLRINNSLVLNDPYLFINNGQNDSSILNILNLLDFVIPQNLNIDYHVTIFSSDHPNIQYDPISEARCKQIAEKLIRGIKGLRADIKILVDIVLTKTVHDRYLFLNYSNLQTEKGFCLFAPNKNGRVLERMWVRYERAFQRTEPSEGDTPFEYSRRELLGLFNKQLGVMQYLRNLPQTVHRRMFGDLTTSNDLVPCNRLLKQ
jgi:hypothetical protein